MRHGMPMSVREKNVVVINEFDAFLKELCGKHPQITKEEARRMILRREMGRFAELVEGAEQL